MKITPLRKGAVKSFRNNYLALLIPLFLSFTAQAQWIKPNNAYGTISNGQNIQRILLFPTGCGAPSLPNSADSAQLKYAIYGDSCNNKVYFYNPKTVEWSEIPSGSGTVIIDNGSVDSVTYSENTICQWIDGTSTCYHLSKFYDSTSLNHDSTKIIHFNGGTKVDSLSLPVTEITVDKYMNYDSLEKTLSLVISNDTSYASLDSNKAITEYAAKIFAKNYADSVGGGSGKLNISDTAAMLAPYITDAGTSLSGGDTTIFETIVDSTGQPQRRILFSGGSNHISSSPKILIDSANSKVGINVPNISIGGPDTKLYVKGNSILDAGVKLPGLGTSVADTGTYKPAVLDGSGNVKKLDRWPCGDAGGGGGGGVLIIKQEYTGSSTVTVTDSTTWLIINPSSLAAAITVTLAESPSDGQTLDISFGGTITSGDVVTALTISPNTGQTILQATTPSSIEAGEVISYRYNSTNSKWYRL